MPAEGATRPFVERGVEDVAAASAVAGEAARRWGLPAPTLLRVGMNAIFTAGDVVLRAGRPTAPAPAALALARVLDGHGVRVALPAGNEHFVSGDVSVTAWERLVPIDADVAWREVGAMVARVHRLAPAHVPDGYPLPPCTAFPWWRFEELLDEVGPLADPTARDGLRAAVERHRGWQAGGGWVVCHGDVHWGNVVMTAGGPVLIDWDMLCSGPPAWDHAPLIPAASRWGKPAHWYAEFATGYGRSLEDDPVAQSVTELRLVAATLMRLRAGRDDPAAMPEAQRRLAYWRGDSDPPTWTAV